MCCQLRVGLLRLRGTTSLKRFNSGNLPFFLPWHLATPHPPHAPLLAHDLISLVLVRVKNSERSMHPNRIVNQKKFNLAKLSNFIFSLISGSKCMADLLPAPRWSHIYPCRPCLCPCHWEEVGGQHNIASTYGAHELCKSKSQAQDHSPLYHARYRCCPARFLHALQCSHEALPFQILTHLITHPCHCHPRLRILQKFHHHPSLLLPSQMYH